MTEKSWRFTVTGHDADGTLFEVTDSVQCELIDAFKFAMKEAFWRLTEGRAVFGNPGVGCRGPYSMTRVLIEEIEH